MKVGSIVVVKPIPASSIDHLIKWKPIQDEETPYMIRGIDTYNGETSGERILCVIFEEGIIGYHSDGLEIYLKKDYVREILPPENLEEFIEECCCVPVENTIANGVKRIQNGLRKFINGK